MEWHGIKEKALDGHIQTELSELDQGEHKKKTKRKGTTYCRFGY